MYSKKVASKAPRRPQKKPFQPGKIKAAVTSKILIGTNARLATPVNKTKATKGYGTLFT